MKKSLAICLGLLSASVLANQAPTQISEQFKDKPLFALDVIDKSNKVGRVVAGRKYSIGNKNHSLCWTAWNLPFQLTNKSIEVFTSPKKAKFTSPDASVVTKDDGKTHIITHFNMPVVNNEFIQRCWSFDKTDPLGKYTLTVRINDIEYPTQTFELIK